MTKIAFIGLGQIGAPIARNIAAAPGVQIHGFDAAPVPDMRGCRDRHGGLRRIGSRRC